VKNKKSLNIFLSYGHDQNTPLVEMIKAALEKRGHDVWYDKSEIKTGDDWRRAITDGIDKSDKVLSVLSKHATRIPGVCRDEIAIALAVKGGNIQTILVEDEKTVSPPVNIGHIQWLDMSLWQSLHEKGGNAWTQWFEEKIDEIIRVVESDESRRFAGEIELLKQYLQPVSSDARINELLIKGFYGRTWLMNDVEEWRLQYHNPSRVFVLLAEAGVGKSAFAAYLTHNRGDVVVASHFCRWNMPLHSSADIAVKSIAFQMATKLPDYRKFLLKLPEIKNLGERNPAELFDYLIASPLSITIHGGRERYVIMIDAVDEANTLSGQNELVSLLANEFEKTPQWLSLLVTSRPENEVLAELDKFRPHIIDAHSNVNIDDIRVFLEGNFKSYTTPNRQEAIKSILSKCEGNFLYAVEICNDIKNGYVDINAPDKFPLGMGNLYLNTFNRKFKEADYNKSILPALEVLTTALEPIHTNHVCKLLTIKKRELNDILLTLGSLFTVHEEKIQPFHKSLPEWLFNRKAAGRYYVDSGDALQSMGEMHDKILEDLFANKQNIDGSDDYIYKYPLVHIYIAGMHQVLTRRILQIFETDDNGYKVYEPLLNNLIDWVVKNIPVNSENTLKAALQSAVASAQSIRRVSLFFYKRGNAYENIGYSSWALEFFEKSLKVMQDLVALEPDRTDFRRDLSVSFNNVGNIYKAMGDAKKALEFFEKSLKVRQDLVALEPDRTDFMLDYAISHWNIYRVCSNEDELLWLNKCRSILLPLIEQGKTYAQLNQLWEIVNDAIEKRKK